jgi:hypothetical protein
MRTLIEDILGEAGVGGEQVCIEWCEYRVYTKWCEYWGVSSGCGTERCVHRRWEQRREWVLCGMITDDH